MSTMLAGLCDSCAWQQEVRTGRGSVFSLCRRAKEDPRFPKYPRVPVGSCPGYEPRPPARDEGGQAGAAPADPTG